jgi:HupE / UreJ protein
MQFVRLLIYVLVSLFFVLPLQAHQVATVEFEFLELESQWRLQGEMDIAYMLPETRNIPGGLPMSRKAVMQSTPEEFARIRKETESKLRKLLKIRFGDQDVAWRVEFPDFSKAPCELPEEAGDIALLTTRLVMDSLTGQGELMIDWAGEQETELIILIEEGDEPQIMSTQAGGSLMLLRQTGSGEVAPIVKPVSGGWLQYGYFHVFGLDHFLFILGLFFLAPRWKPLVQQSLLFTLAHSITLALAVFGMVKLNGDFLQILIPATIAWVGIENLWVKKLGKYRLILVFCFGLLHGLAFASGLTEKLSRISHESLFWPLLGFNVGLELAQISVILAAFLLLWPIQKWSQQVQMVGSTVVAFAGLIWLAQELFF